MRQLDVIIIGAGPAGIAAGLNTLETGLNFLILESGEPLEIFKEYYPKGKEVIKHPPDFKMPDDMWFENCSVEEFLEKWGEYVRKLGHHMHTQEPVIGIEKKDDHFLVKTKNSEYETRFVVLAIGNHGRPRKLGVPGEELDNVHYRLKDPNEYAGMTCLVIGGGDTAAETAILLANSGANVIMSYRREKFFRLKPENLQKVEGLEKQGKIRIIFKSNVTRIGRKTAWLDIDGKEEMIDIDHVFICIGAIPNKEFLESIGLELDNMFRPVVNENLETSIPGIFAAGDLVNKIQLITYAADSGWKVIEEIKKRLKNQ